MKGFVLLEMCFVLVCVPMIMNLSLMVLHQLKQTDMSYLINHRVFQVQVQRLLGASMHVEGCTYTHANEAFTLVLHRNRLVKKPGYHILLEGIESLECRDGKVYYVYEGQSFQAP